jgi:DNA repair exonuclease SbcCD ATPase subunit
MELTQEQQQALQNLTKVFSLTASQETFNRFFQDDLEDLKTLKERQDEINDELKDLMQYADMGASNVADIMEEFSSNERDIRKINNRLQMARGLLVELGVNLV